MGEYLFPITVEGNWRPEHAKSVKNVLQNYFQSKNSQGGDCIVQNHNQNAATILFKSSKTRDDVLSKEEHIITIENYKVTLQVRKHEDVTRKQPESTGQLTGQACGFQEPANKKDFKNESAENVPEKKDSYFRLLNTTFFKSMRVKLKLPVIEVMEVTPAVYSLLQQVGLQTASPQLHLDYNKKMSQLHLSGLHTEILTFKNWVLEKKLSMKEKPVKVNCSLLEFLRSVDCDDMSKALFIAQGINAVYTVENEDLVLIGSTGQALSEAEKSLKTGLRFSSLTVEDQNILAMPQWQCFISGLQNEYNTPHKKVLINFSNQRNEVRVSGFSESVIKVCENLGDFIEKHTRIEDAVPVKSHAVVEFIKDRKSQDWQHLMKSDEVTVRFDSERPRIKLSGERRFVQPAMSFFKKMADALYTDSLIIKKAGAKKYFKEEGQLMLLLFMKENRYMVVLQEDHIQEEEDKNNQVPLGQISRVQVGEVTVEVLSGDITKEKTDAIVNSSNQTFSLKAGVSKAILNAAGLQVEQELSQIARDTNYQLTEIVTPVRSGNLPCKDIIHIVGRKQPDEIKDAVFSVLKICEAHCFTSVAFPALGTGLGEANPADVADAMISAVIDFVKKEKPVHVKSVKFLLFQKSIEADFHQSILGRANEKEEKKGLLSRIKGIFEPPTNEEPGIVVEEIEQVVFQLCGESPQDLSKASDMINLLSTQKHKDVTIKDPAICHFTKEDVEMLNAVETELKVSIKLENTDRGPIITLKGLKGIIHTAESRIQGIIRRVEKNEHRKREATLISKIVEWQYEQKKNDFKTFDILTNYDLEEAFNLHKTSVTVMIDNTEYDADVVNKVARKGKKQIKLKRIDLKAQIPLPSNWEDMKGQLVVLVKLTASSQEYADAEKEFRRTGLTSNIIQIQRVQNSTLWSNYTIQKRHLEDKNKHNNNEKLLFHGTGPDNTDQINHHGFNRSYAGIHGALFGNGTYFAVDPRYSAQGYSPPDKEGHKRMYLARVLVGDFTQGKKGLPAPPKKRSNAIDLYDSVTDNTKKPSMFVVFHDVQAYPEYLITFQE